MSTDFRKEILSRLKAIGHNRAWLAKELKGNPSRNALYTYLRKKGDMHGERIARILDILASEKRKAKKQKRPPSYR